jgi:hypothetical protein
LRWCSVRNNWTQSNHYSKWDCQHGRLSTTNKKTEGKLAFYSGPKLPARC